MIAALGLALFALGDVRMPPLGGPAILVGAVAVAAAAAVFISKPGLFLALYVTYGTLAPVAERMVGLPLASLKGGLFLVAFPLWLLSSLALDRRSAWWSGTRTPVTCMLIAGTGIVVLSLVSWLQGTPLLQIANAARGHLLYPPLLLVAFSAAGDVRDVQRFLWLLLALTILVALGAVVQAALPLAEVFGLGLSLETGAVAYLAVDPLSGRVFQRVFSILHDQSALAAFSLTGMVIGLYLHSIVRPLRLRILSLVGLALNGYALILTYNMTVLMGTVLFVLILAFRKRSVKLLSAFLLVTVVIALLAWIHLGELITHRLESSFTLRPGSSTSLVSRLDSNRQALGMVQESPLVGHGLGSTANTAVYYRLGMHSTPREGGFATDNFYMTTTVEMGIIGLGAVLLLHLLPLWPLWRLRLSPEPEARALHFIGSTYVIVMLVLNLSNGPMHTNPTNLLYWSLAGWAWRWSGVRIAGSTHVRNV